MFAYTQFYQFQLKYNILVIFLKSLLRFITMAGILFELTTEFLWQLKLHIT